MQVEARMVSQRIVVVGTGTGIGKTHVSCALLLAAAAAGRPYLGLKPIETGIAEDGSTAEEDGERLRVSSGRVFHVKQIAPYRFVPPISPHLAAREAGVVIEPKRIRDYVDAVAGEGPVLVETAGGLFSPLGPGLTNLDLVNALAPCRVLLVAADRLGVLHEVTATIGLSRARGVSPDVVVLSAPSEPDISTGTNAAELAWLGIASVEGVFPREAPATAASRAVAERVWARLVG